MFEVEDWVEELIEKIMNIYGCTRRQAIDSIEKNLY